MSVSDIFYILQNTYVTRDSTSQRVTMKIDKGKTRVIWRKSQQSNFIHTEFFALAYQMCFAIARS